MTAGSEHLESRGAVMFPRYGDGGGVRGARQSRRMTKTFPTKGSNDDIRKP